MVDDSLMESWEFGWLVEKNAGMEKLLQEERKEKEKEKEGKVKRFKYRRPER